MWKPFAAGFVLAFLWLCVSLGFIAGSVLLPKPALAWIGLGVVFAGTGLILWWVSK